MMTRYWCLLAIEFCFYVNRGEYYDQYVDMFNRLGIIDACMDRHPDDEMYTASTRQW